LSPRLISTENLTMAKFTRIHHPLADDPPPAGVVWAAFGYSRCPERRRISGQLKDKDGKPIGPREKALVQPPSWVIVFSTRLEPASAYYLEVLDGDEVLAAHSFTTKPPPPKAEAVRPSYPTPGTVVHPTFSAYGGCDFAVTGVVGQPGQPPIPGVVLQGPPAYLIKFSNVPPGTNYTLTITEMDSPPLLIPTPIVVAT
jgi:hypothetical protein